MITRICKRKKVLIAGDSWGLGEWESRCRPYRSTHPGLQKYLEEEGNTVDNISEGAGTLDLTYSNLKNLRDNGELIKYDYIFVFVTDPFRRGEMKDDNFWKICNNKEKLLNKRDVLVREFLEKLNFLMTPICLIGGLQKLYPTDVEGLKYLDLTVPSMVEAVLPHRKHWDVAFYDYLHNISYDLSPEYVDYIYDDYKNYESITKNELIFRGDNNHPNRAGHYLLKEYLRGLETLDLFYIEKPMI